MHVDDLDISPSKRSESAPVVGAPPRRQPRGQQRPVAADANADRPRDRGARHPPASCPWWRETLTIRILLWNFCGPAWAVLLSFVLALLIALPIVSAGGGDLIRRLR